MEFVREAADLLDADETHFRAAILEGFAAIDRGNVIGEEEMDARIPRILNG